MLHGIVPAAFFATLLRRYLDSFSESTEYVAPSSSLGLETSAVVATVGIAAYGLVRISRKKQETLQNESFKTIGPKTPTKGESCTRVNMKAFPRKITRKRYRKYKTWFLEHMRHYKSKYGRQIGKLMNQFLGVPLAESQAADPVDLDSSNDEEEVALEPFVVFESPPYIGDSGERSAKEVPGCNGEDGVAPSCDRLDDVDTEAVGSVRVASSSLHLDDLRDNCEMHMKRTSSRSFESQSSSGSYRSGCGENNVIHHSRSSSKRSRISAKSSRSREMQIRGRSRKKSPYRERRSGRSYSKSSS